jgi:hypothetical protein
LRAGRQQIAAVASASERPPGSTDAGRLGREAEMGYHLINLTPHSITLACGMRGEYRMTVPPSGTVARVRETVTDTELVPVMDGIKPVIITLAERTFGEIEGLPAPSVTTMYIVSAMVAETAWSLGRRDVVCPGDFERDSEGRIIAARRLLVNPRPTSDTECLHCGYIRSAATDQCERCGTV